MLADNALDRLIFQDEERPSGPVSPPGPIEGFPSGRELLDLGGGYLPTRAIATMAGAAGAMASDAASLARWGYLLYGGFVLRSDTLAAMIDISRGYGLGCNPIVESGLDGIGHSGSLPGYQSLLYADSSSGTIVAVLVSSSSWDPRVTGADLMRAVDGG